MRQQKNGFSGFRGLILFFFFKAEGLIFFTKQREKKSVLSGYSRKIR
jgi:hypothetical protein